MNPKTAWQRVERTVDRARERSGVLDHFMAMLGHYGRVDGNGQAGSVTYFAFLAFFPIMALMFFAVGLSAGDFGIDDDQLAELVNAVVPDLIGEQSGQIRPSVFEDNAAKAGVLGLLGFLYAGLGWMSAMRMALQTLFDKPQKDRPNLFVGKARDLMTLGIVGVMLLIALALTTAVNHYAGEILDAVGLDRGAALPKLALQLTAAVLAVFLIASLLTVLYKLLARPRVSLRALREGAVLAAIGFVLLKLVADRLMQLTQGQPAFTIFGFALVLLVLINYFSRVVMYGAAWAYTSGREPDLFEEEQVGPHWRNEPVSGV